MNRIGVMYSNATVPKIIPPITPIARECDPLEPTPVAKIIGSSPSIIVADVIMIGRRRWRAANSADVFMSLP